MQADRQEALVRAEQRRMAIERANKVLFDATDDVRALHSKLLLSEVRALPVSMYGIVGVSASVLFSQQLCVTV